MQWKSLARHPIRHLIELGTSNANTPAGSEETIGVGARVRLIHSDDPYTKLEPGDEGIVTSITPLPESQEGINNCGLIGILEVHLHLLKMRTCTKIGGLILLLSIQIK